MPEDELDNTHRQDNAAEEPVTAKAVTATGIHTLVGETIEAKYRVIERLGSGGMGAVYKAEHSMMERMVALKVLHPHLIENDDLMKRFQHEARVASKLDHPHAIRTYDFGIWHGAPYLVMEYVSGRTLKDRMADVAPISTVELREIFLQVCSALAQAHELGIVHRDLKPDNIMLTKANDGSINARVLDFGIAKVLNESSGKNQTLLTQAGTFFGTPKYASPEQVLEKRLDGRSDIYTLGIILYEVISGETPFEAPSVVEILMKQLHEAPQPLRKFKPDLRIDPKLEDIVMKCLEKDPDKRFQNMNELAAALREIGSDEGVSTGAKLLTAAIGIAAVAVFAMYLRMRSSSPLPEEPKKEALPAAVETAAVTAAAATSEQAASRSSEQAPTAEPSKSSGNPFFALVLKQAVHAMHSGSAASEEPALNTEPAAPEPEIQNEAPPAEPPAPPVEERAAAEVIQQPPLIEQPPAIEQPPVAEQPPAIEQPAVIAQPPAPAPSENIRREIADSESGKKEAIKLYTAGRTLLQQKRYGEAAAKFEQAIQYRSDAIGSFISLGVCYQRLGQNDKARAAFLNAVKIDPSYGPVHYNLAAFYAATGDWNGAASSLQQAIRLDSQVRSLVRTDPDFAAFRERPEYRAVIGR